MPQSERPHYRAAVEARVRLHLLRYRNEPSDFIRAETVRASDRLAAGLERIRSLGIDPVAPAALRDAYVAPADPMISAIVYGDIHYLGTRLRAGSHYALHEASTRRPFVFGTLSPFDLNHVTAQLRNLNLHQENTMCLSRLCALPSAPPNALSYFLSLLTNEARHSKVDFLMTYCDPNVGFPGTIYKASNWHLAALEKKERYLYIDGEYVTDRACKAKYGTADYNILLSITGGGIQRSQHPLVPLQIFILATNRRSRLLVEHLAAPVTICPDASITGGGRAHE